MTDGVVTSREAARRLRVHVRTVHRMIADGRLKKRDQVDRYHGDFLIDEDDVERLVAAKSSTERERAS